MLKITFFVIVLFLGILPCMSQTMPALKDTSKTRVIVTSDGEIDDECSMVRFLLYANEWDIEGIITSSSQYHWHGHKWAGDDWIDPYLIAYTEVYPNLIKHDKNYPTPDYLKSINLLGNVEAEGEMDSITPGSLHIVKVLLDESDNRPVWIQAWGGTNTIARALKTIEEEYPEKMEKVANKLRFFFIWEQDSTYQAYIRPHWRKYNIPTIISDQFWALAYQWDKIMPEDKLPYFRSEWMKANVLENHGLLCSLYEAYKGGEDNEGWRAGDPKQKGAFRSEGDSPAFIFTIPSGLRSMESPDYGGWGGRYVKVRENTWLDHVPQPGYIYPEGRWYTNSAWGRQYMKNEYPKNLDLMSLYFNPITRWADAVQNDFASRADWCVKSYKEANHPPAVKLANAMDITAKPGSKLNLSAKGTSDPDGDKLTFHWWQYEEADTYPGNVAIENPANQETSLTVPVNTMKGQTIHVVCEVTDAGTPQLTRYQRVIITIN